MPQTPHIEKHFTSGAAVRDIVIGMADGLTVPFALAAGLTGATAVSASIIVTAGLAEITAGSIAMGLGGYLAGKSDAEHYESEYKRETYEIEKLLDHEKDEVMEILETYGLTRKESLPIVESLAERPKDFADFMMRFELGLEKRRRVSRRPFRNCCAIWCRFSRLRRGCWFRRNTEMRASAVPTLRSSGRACPPARSWN